MLHISRLNSGEAYADAAHEEAQTLATGYKKIMARMETASKNGDKLLQGVGRTAKPPLVVASKQTSSPHGKFLSSALVTRPGRTGRR